MKKKKRRRQKDSDVINCVKAYFVLSTQYAHTPVNPRQYLRSYISYIWLKVYEPNKTSQWAHE